MKRRLAQLEALCDILQERELAELRRLARQREEMRAEMTSLRETRRSALASSDLSPARLAGAEEPWLRLQSERLRSLGTKEARVAAEFETQLLKARKALGRAQAMKGLKERHGQG